MFLVDYCIKSAASEKLVSECRLPKIGDMSYSKIIYGIVSVIVVFIIVLLGLREFLRKNIY